MVLLLVSAPVLLLSGFFKSEIAGGIQVAA
jgi:hypothetical protein